jgi:hypothetical protein
MSKGFRSGSKPRYSALHLSRLGGFNYLDDDWMRGAIDFTKKSLAVTKEVPPSQVFDFTFVEKALGRSKN